jgi:plastocyanin
MSGHEQGPGAVAFLDDVLYVLQDSAGTPEFITQGFPNGVYAVEKDGGVRLVGDISTWINENPVAHVPGDKTDLGETFAMLAGKGELWVLESNSGQVLTVTPDGKITRVADLSENHPVPTAFAAAPDGAVYVGFLTPAPYTDGSSRVVKVTASGEVTEVWTGLTMVTALAVGPDGTLYAVEMSTGNTDEPPFTQPASGRVVRQTGPSSHEEVVTGLDYPIAGATGPDGGLYVGFPAFGSDDVTGGIIRIDIASITETVAVPADILDETRCAASMVATPAATMAASDGGVATPEVTPAGTTAPGASPVVNDKSQTGAIAVDIKNFAFVPAEIRVPVGTVVTWTNSDVVAHTATEPGGAFNSGNLNPGQSFSFTFDTAGTYAYICNYHPFMKGTVIVE